MIILIFWYCNWVTGHNIYPYTLYQDNCFFFVLVFCVACCVVFFSFSVFIFVCVHVKLHLFSIVKVFNWETCYIVSSLKYLNIN